MVGAVSSSDTLEAESARVVEESALEERASRGGVPNFAGAGSRFSSFGHPSSRQPVFDGRPSRSMPGNIARNGNAMPSVLYVHRKHPLQRRLNGIETDHIAERHEPNWHGNWDPRHAHFDHGHFFVFINGFWCGLDDGFFPWDYLPYYPNDYYPVRLLRDVDPNHNPGAGYKRRPSDTATVQAVQTAACWNWAITPVQSMASSRTDHTGRGGQVSNC